MVALTPLVINKPVLKNPVGKNRSPADRHINLTCLIVILSTSWFISCSIYLIKPSLLLIQVLALYSGINVTLNEDGMSLSSINFHENEIGFNTWIILSGPIIFFLLLKSLYILPKFWAAIGLFLSFPFFMLLPLHRISKIIYEAFYCTSHEFSQPWLRYTFIELYQVALYLLIFHGAVINFCRLAKVIKKTSRVISFFPALFLFGFITLMLSTTVIAFAIVGYKYFSDTAYGYASLFGGIYVFLLIFHFVIALISQCAFTWCCTENKKDLTGFIILKSICLTFRNHGRLILFNCTVILPAFRWMFFSRTHKFDPAFPQIGLKTYMVREWLISNGLEHALPVVTSHEATKEKIYSIFTRNWFLCFSFSAVFGTLLALFSAIEKIIVFYGASVISVWSNSTHVDLLNQSVIYLALLIYSFGFMFVSLAIGASVLIFSITEDIKESVEQEVIAVKEAEGIELCIINQNSEIAES